MSYKPLSPKKNRSYIWEVVRQLKVIGIFEVLCMLLLLIRMAYIVNSPYQLFGDYDYYQTIYEDTYISTNLIGIVFGIVVCFTVMMAMLAFSFLYSRKASDFQYTVPMSRTKLMLSKFAGIIIWQAITICLGMFGGIGAAYLRPQNVSFDYLMLFKGILLIIIAVIYLTAIVILAFSLSGNLFSGLVLMGILLAYVRLLINLVYISMSWIPVIDVAYMEESSFLGRNNIVVTYLAHLSDVTSNNTILITWKNLLCSAVIAILLLALAYYAFKIRKSETTGKSFGYRLIRVIVRYLVCLAMAVVILTDMISRDWKFSIRGRMGNFIVYIVLTVILMFVYERLSSKKFHIKYVAITVVLSYLSAFGVCYGLLYVERNTISFTPQPEDVEYVEAYIEYAQLSEPSDYDIFLDSDKEYYVIDLDSRGQNKPDFIEQVCEVLEKNVEEMDDNFFYGDKDMQLRVTFYQKGKQKIVRNVYFTAEDMQKVKQYLNIRIMRE